MTTIRRSAPRPIHTPTPAELPTNEGRPIRPDDTPALPVCGTPDHLPQLPGGKGGDDVRIIRGNEGAVVKARMEQAMAQRIFDNTVSAAKADGQITDAEQRSINGAGRNLNIAKKNVELQEAKQDRHEVLVDAMKDRKITMAERRALATAAAREQKLATELQALKMRDGILDAIEDGSKFPSPPGPRGPVVNS